MLLHKAHANWCYLIIAELRPMYDSIPINLRTGSQAELGKKRVGEQSEPSGAWGRKNGGRDCFAFWCARDILHPTAGRTGLATVKTDQSEASPKIGDWA